MEDTRPGLICGGQQADIERPKQQLKDKEASVGSLTSAPTLNKGGHAITCDQVTHLMDIFDRYLPASKHVRVSQEREMLQYGMLYEVMEVARLRFEDENARWNGTPNPARDYDK
jgi:hypothetical protein